MASNRTVPSLMRRISIWPETNHGPFGAMKTTESARSRKGTLCGDDTPTGSSTAVVENPFPEEGPRNLASTLIDLNSLQDITFKSVHVKSNISLNDRFIYLAKMFEHVKTELKAEAKLSSVEDVTLVPNPRNLSAFPLFRAFRSTYLSPVFPVILKEQWPTPKLKIIGSKLTPQAVEFRKFLEKKALKRFARRSARRGRDSRIIRSRWNQSASKGAETRKTKITTSKEDGGIDLGPSEKLSGSREAKEVRILKKECSSARRKEEPRDKTEAKCGSRKAIQINHREPRKEYKESKRTCSHGMCTSSSKPSEESETYLQKSRLGSIVIVNDRVTQSVQIWDTHVQI